MATPSPVAQPSGQSEQQNDDGEIIRSGNLTIDAARFTVTVDAKSIELAYKEFELLRFLVCHVGQVFDRNALMWGAWGKDQVQKARTVDVHVARLRKKLKGTHPYRIVTVRKRGYGFIQDPDNRYERAS